MGTRKISQLDTIADANLSGEAILPVVVSDPLIPNRKVKVNQLFKGISQGSKAEPGLCFDLDRDTGLYQDAYDQIGIGFGDGGLYMSRIENTATSSSLYITATDETSVNADIVLSPKGTGSVNLKKASYTSSEITSAGNASTLHTFIICNSGTALAVGMANGTIVGEKKIFTNKGAGTATITPTTFGPGTSIALAQHQGCQMIWDGTNWQLIGNYGGTVS